MLGRRGIRFFEELEDKVLIVSDMGRKVLTEADIGMYLCSLRTVYEP